MLAENVRRPKRERLTRIRIFEDLRAQGYEGGYDAVRRYAASWSKATSEASADAYVPLSFDPGEAFQFDWSHEIAIIDGVTTTIKVAHVRLCHSRMVFVRAYPRETQEMVFDAHDKAFAFFGGACARGIYDNMKTAVDAIFVGKDRAYNRRFQQMSGHYLFEPVACTPASGWEKGQVENQVGVIRRRFVVLEARLRRDVPRPKFKNYAELNAWLQDRCVAWAKANPHPEFRDKTIWEVFEGEPSRRHGFETDGERPLQGLGSAASDAPDPPQARACPGRRSSDGGETGRPADRRGRGGRGRLRRGTWPRRPLRRCRPQHSRPTPGSRAARADCHPGRAEAGSGAGRRLRPIRHPEEPRP